MAGSRRHIAIIAPPTLGHINPLIALATSLGRIGYRSTLVHVADVAPLVAGTSLAFEPLGGAAGCRVLEAFRARVASPTGPIGLNRMIRATADLTALLLEELPSALGRIGADAVIADSVEPAGALVARHLGLPFVTSVTGLPLLREPDVPPPFVGWRYRADTAARSRNRSGYAVADLLMRPIERVVGGYRRRWGLPEEDKDGGSPLLQVAQCPALFDFPRASLPAAFRYGSPWRLPEPAMARPSDDPRPLVFCSLGTLQGSRKRLFAAITRACAMVGARAIVAHGGGLSESEAASLPGDPLVRAFWPQRAVLAHCAAAVLHGGFNSVLDALAAGVPIVAVPIAFEQPATAARVEWTGAGVVVPPPVSSSRRLARAMAAVLDDPRYRLAARAIGDTMGKTGAADAAALVDAAFRGAPVPPA